LPFLLDHINLWLLEDGDGWTVVDTGVATDAVKDAWRALFAGPLAGRLAKRMIVTHFHPDHMGLAGWLEEAFDVPLSTSLGEWAFGRMLYWDDAPDTVEMFCAFYGRAGFDRTMRQVVRDRGNPYPERVAPLPNQFIRLQDGQTVTIDGRAWRVIVGTGHSPEHLCLHCPELNVLISGDQVLPRISPNVSVWPHEPEADPLRLFLDSLPKFSGLPDDVLVLPSHDRPFRGLHGRLDALAHHHDQRLADALDACVRPCTALDILKVLFRREMDTHQKIFAIGEALAHLHFLMGQGLVTRRRDGAVDLYQRA
ncbi:MAG: MBL fold metallo-hydrolase, partial [Rhodobacterales bacterium]|nr:MBL fold metallo-hydrolase [Rhodobacterales bacterium]